jgi:hypothetical protein
MILLDYLLIIALITTGLYALYSSLIRWLHTPVRESVKPDNQERFTVSSARSCHAQWTQRSAGVHAVSR